MFGLGRFRRTKLVEEVAPPGLTLTMSEKEAALFESFVRCARVYVEFGAGGSTVLATKRVQDKVISVDSSAEWLGRVRHTIDPADADKLVVHQADVGPVKDWGFPDGEDYRDMWPSYSTFVWNIPDARNGDLYLIDGRFRVSCFAETILRAPVGTVVLIHDFENRPEYHVVKPLARYLAVSENLSAFIKENNSTEKAAKALAEEYRYNFD